MQNEKTIGEIEYNIPGGEVMLVLVIESEIRDRRTEVRDQKSTT